MTKTDNKGTDTLTSVGIAADLGFFQPPTNNPLTSDGNIGLAPKTVIEPGTITFPASITINQYGQVIGAVDGNSAGTQGVTAVGIASPNNTITVSNTPILSSGTIDIDLPVINASFPLTPFKGAETIFTFNTNGILTDAKAVPDDTVLSSGYIADYGYVPYSSASNGMVFVSSNALQLNSGVLIQPVLSSAGASDFGLAAIGMTYYYVNFDEGTPSKGLYINPNLSISSANLLGYFWAIINPTIIQKSFVRPLGLITINNVNTTPQTINFSDYNVTPSSKAAFFLSVSRQSFTDPSATALITGSSSSNSITLCASGVCNVSILIVDSTKTADISRSAVIIDSGVAISDPSMTSVSQGDLNFNIPFSPLMNRQGSYFCFATPIALPNPASAPLACSVSTVGTQVFPPPASYSYMNQFNGYTGAFIESVESLQSVPLLGLTYVTFFVPKAG